METIAWIIDNLWVIMKYYVPGALALNTFDFVSGKCAHDREYYIFHSLVVSGLLVYLPQNCQFISDYFILPIACLCGVMLAFLFAKVSKSDHAQRILSCLRIRKTTRTFWEDVIDVHNGTYMDVLLKGDELRCWGSVEYVEPVEGDAWISLIDISIDTGRGQTICPMYGTRLIFKWTDAQKVFVRSAKLSGETGTTHVSENETESV